jgi:hypothetical protein
MTDLQALAIMWLAALVMGALDVLVQARRKR